ncbi:pyridoxal phosphate-dependent aminotransferase [Anaerofustis stercorihominis]|uniref:pyridoxal phosphate-dependent aminotransferase n=1 Tax=Anaerofustis stercorihominis TaxID=214853 RepID=UPI00214D1203|nr:pyridoxal phosphate-dependent aminotransferase [Anaerofustis stercorihominis]MCR2033114.1 pyridoxal phosphate-dependent aminotransferase [Anaerofustis stercorihominis]
MFSNKVTSIGQSPIREFAPIQEKRIEEGTKVYQLNIGQPDIVTPKEFFSAVNNFDESILAYTNSKGIPSLLEAFEDYYKEIGTDLTKEDMIVTNGGSEAISFAFLTLCNENDEIIAFEPYYTNYNIFATQAGVNMVSITTKPEENFRLPKKKEIEAKITDKTRAFCITNPSNPTGRVYTRDEIDLLCEIAKEHDLFIIVDEVYREFVYDGEFISFSSVKGIEDRVIIIDSISKRFSACGARIGLLASKNEEFMAHVLKLAQARLCAPYLDQVGAAAVLKNTSKDYISAVKKEYKNRRDTIYNRLKKVKGIEVKKPAGAFYMIVKLPVENAHEFSKWLLEKYDHKGETVMLCPANEFYATKELGVDEVRIAYVLKEEDLIKAVNILDKGLIAYQKALAEEKAVSLNKKPSVVLNKEQYAV